MENKLREYVEVDRTPGRKLPNKIYTDTLPDVYVSKNRVELQELHYSNEGKGRRSTYNCRSTTTLDFNNSHLFSPLRSKLHKHDFFELMLIASDDFEMQIESQLCEFTKWDVCILNRSVRHAEHFKPEAKVFYLVMSPEYLLNWPQEEGMSLQRSLLFTKFFDKGLRDTSCQNKEFIAFRYTDQAIITPIYGIIRDIRREFENKNPGYQFFIRGLLYRLFCTLVDPTHYITEYINLGSDDGFSLAFSAKQILDKNKRKMTNLQMAEKLNYNSEYINRVFKKHYGYSISEYNRLICIREAASMLCHSNQNIHGICKLLGFSNRTHFYNLFKNEYGYTPSDYRKKCAKR